MGQALYRKYRSRSLDEIVGQSHITAMLKRAIANDHVAHAYLLTGPRGVGKTSIARILAHEINGLPYDDESTHLDIIEIDAASNNSVEDVRDLRERVQIAPVSAKRKIYIIDEVHMLSKSAFNALLKTLEEPPAHAVFILATTDADKLPATIISRVQRFNFRAITPSDAAQHLRMIATREAIEIDDEALTLIAEHGRGSFRDSISLLDQLQNISNGPIDRRLVESVLGLVEHELLTNILDAYERGDIGALVGYLDEAETHGTSAVLLTEQLIQLLQQQLVDHPEFLPLLDQLLEIGRSSWPKVKLLTALSARVTASSTTAPVAPQESVPEHPNTLSQPKKAAPKPPVAQKPASATSSEPRLSQVKPPQEPEKQMTNDKKMPEGSTQPFPWQDFLDYIKSQQATGAHSILTKCGYEFDGTTLTIYAGKKFAKAQLDKSLPVLSQALASIGVEQGQLVTLASPTPPKDSKTAAVLAIMGGGEEVTIDGK